MPEGQHTAQHGEHTRHADMDGLCGHGSGNSEQQTVARMQPVERAAQRDSGKLQARWLRLRKDARAADNQRMRPALHTVHKLLVQCCLGSFAGRMMHCAHSDIESTGARRCI